MLGCGLVWPRAESASCELGAAPSSSTRGRAASLGSEVIRGRKEGRPTFLRVVSNPRRQIKVDRARRNMGEVISWYPEGPAPPPDEAHRRSRWRLPITSDET
jgi:hypothetical protein